MTHNRKKRGAVPPARPPQKISQPIADKSDDNATDNQAQALIWTPAERERMLDAAIAITASPSIVPDDPNERLPMRVARRELDRLARERLKLGVSAAPQRPDMAAVITAAEFSRARRRGRR